jgi:ribA/ribD-fused uncharacterized protein
VQEKSLTRVVNIRREKCDIYAGRPSLFGNPFPVSTYGRKKAIARYTTYFYERVLTDPHFLQAVYRLRDRKIGCYCHPLPCHVGVIANFLNRGFMIINKFRGEYIFLSMFYVRPVLFDRVKYKSGEHAFQTYKVKDPENALTIKRASTPAKAKEWGSLFMARENWNDIRDDVMLAVNRAKFRDPYLQDKLLRTYPARLIECNTWKDHYWGVCNGIGENRLGRVLMKVRREIRNAGEQSCNRV